MRSILCSGAVLLFVLLSINGLVVVDGASCKGGRSVRGYDLLDDLHRYSPSSSNSLFMTSSCCDDEQGDIVTCHGGVVLQASDVPATATKAIDGQDDAHHTLTLNDAQRHKRSTDEQHQQCDAGCIHTTTTEIHCCPSNMSIFYPISALSAVTGERLHVVQAPPLILQPTIFARCLTEHSPLLDAQCQQDFVPEMMFVAEHSSESANMDAMQILIHRQPVLVENGCTCRFNSQPITLLDGPVVDSSLNTLLNQWSD